MNCWHSTQNHSHLLLEFINVKLYFFSLNKVKTLTTTWATCNKTLTEGTHQFLLKGKTPEKERLWRQKQFKQLLPEESTRNIEKLVYLQAHSVKGEIGCRSQ